jgi:hypothetical protein
MRSIISNDKTTERIARKIGSELSENIHIYFTPKSDSASNGLINISTIESARQTYADRLLSAITCYEFNPFHYILLRIYSDGIPLIIDDFSDIKILPPLATIPQYHSTRIQSQHGVFLISPHYLLEGGAKKLYKSGIDLRALNRQPENCDLLTKILITEPGAIAHALRNIGERKSSLFPELTTYAEEIERFW